MKWYFWIIIIVVVLVVAYIVHNKLTSKTKVPSRTLTNILNGNFGDLLNDSVTRDPKEIVEGLINMKYSFEEIKSRAKERDVLVLNSNEVRTMEFNPRRVIVKQIPIYCIKAPCNDIFVIESIG